MKLNRNADNYFAKIEQAAFSPSNVVPGISHSPDKMLQAHVFSYADAHRYRLSTHYEALPVNQPKCPVHHYHKDGQMNFFGQKTGNVDAYYKPNSFSGAVKQPSAKEPPLALSGNADRYNHRIGNDNYVQVTALFNLFDASQHARLFSNIAAAIGGVPGAIIKRQLAHFKLVHPAYEAGMQAALKEAHSYEANAISNEEKHVAAE